MRDAAEFRKIKDVPLECYAGFTPNGNYDGVYVREAGEMRLVTLEDQHAVETWHRGGMRL